jgi:hypothetical protein
MTHLMYKYNRNLHLKKEFSQKITKLVIIKTKKYIIEKNNITIYILNNSNKM